MYRFTILSLLLSCFVVISCEEKPPTITPCQTERVVLVEEFTGMSCVQCPGGHQKIKQLQAEYPNKIIPVAIHAGALAGPYNGWDFRTSGGTEIHDWSKPVGEPSINVNRQYFADQGVYGIILPTTWAGPIAEEICLPPDVSIDVISTFDDRIRELRMTVNLNPLNTVKMKENVGLTVLITEDKVIAPQLGSAGWESNYEHNHMLRGFVTDTWGLKIQEAGETLTPHQQTFTYELPLGWDADNCHIVAFVHYQGDDRYILQATEKSLLQ